MDLSKLTIEKARQDLAAKKFSALDLINSVFDEIKKKDQKIGAYLTLSEELALRQARRIDKKISNREEVGPLGGIPIAIKDIIMVQALRCTAGSKILENYIAPYDATVVKRLKKAGAVIVGKTNLDEFAMGSSNENSAFGPVKNPMDLERVPGGSSGGSVAAVAANECLGALGSDTGGSIRQPASFCGVVGLKPTYGAVSRYGLIAFASSLDQIGPIAKTGADARLLMEVIAGKDDSDATSMPKQEIADDGFKIKNLKIGVPKEYFVAGIEEKVQQRVQEAISLYEEMGARIEEVSLPHTEYALPAYYIIMPAEASANLARFDGIKYGTSQAEKESIKDLLDVYLRNRGVGFGDEVKRRIMMGTYALSAGYYDAYYLKAQKVRTIIKKEFDKVFEKVDVLMGPTSPTVAFKLGEKSDDPLSMYLSDIYTVPANLAGLPAVSVPCQKGDELPIGLQIIGKPFQEKSILELSVKLSKKL